jgi:hypothetical protein
LAHGLIGTRRAYQEAELRLQASKCGPQKAPERNGEE